VNEARAARDREVQRLHEAEAAAGPRRRRRPGSAGGRSEWVRLRDAAAAAARIAGHAAQKAEFAQQYRDAKGRPYLADPLFRYLWERGYGTAGYRAGPVARLLDGFVARVRPLRRRPARLRPPDGTARAPGGARAAHARGGRGAGRGSRRP
jgi:hypothetical protein